MIEEKNSDLNRWCENWDELGYPLLFMEECKWHLMFATDVKGEKSCWQLLFGWRFWTCTVWLFKYDVYYCTVEEAVVSCYALEWKKNEEVWRNKSSHLNESFYFVYLFILWINKINNVVNDTLFCLHF